MFDDNKNFKQSYILNIIANDNILNLKFSKNFLIDKNLSKIFHFNYNKDINFYPDENLIKDQKSLIECISTYNSLEKPMQKLIYMIIYFKNCDETNITTEKMIDTLLLKMLEQNYPNLIQSLKRLRKIATNLNNNEELSRSIMNKF